MNDEVKTEERLTSLLNQLTDEEFKNWVWEWRDINDLMDIIKNWDKPVKEDAIKEIKNIIKNRNEDYTYSFDKKNRGDDINE